MKKIVRERLAREKRKIERRLRAAVVVNEGGPVMGSGNIVYETAGRPRGIAHGGMGLIQRVVRRIGLAKSIDRRVKLLKIHKPYHESDHVLNIAYNALCGGQRLEDIELRRQDRVMLDALGTASLPDPTTAGDFCRRFDGESIDALMEAINEARLKVWSTQPESFRSDTARIDADGSIVPTTGDCKEGMDISYNGIWGYSALVVSLANTREPLYLANHGANRPSHEGVIGMFDRAIALCRRGGFQDILLRGDTDFSITTEFDRWTEDGVRFVFGYDARANMVEKAGNAPDSAYRELERRAEREIVTHPRTRPEDVKDRIVRQRQFRTIRAKSEDLFEFEYKPVKCRRSYRVIALRKNLSIEKGEEVLFDEIRYFFFITNDRSMTPEASQIAARIAHRRGETLLLVHVVEPMPTDPAGDHNDVQRSTAATALENAAAELRALGITVETDAVIGSPAHEIVAHAPDDTTLFVAGARGHSRAVHWLIGSVAERLARIVPHPLLVVRQARDLHRWLDGVRDLDVLIATDFSPVSDFAMKRAALLHELGPCNVDLTYIEDPPADYQQFGIEGPIRREPSPSSRICWRRS